MQTWWDLQMDSFIVCLNKQKNNCFPVFISAGLFQFLFQFLYMELGGYALVPGILQWVWIWKMHILCCCIF